MNKIEPRSLRENIMKLSHKPSLFPDINMKSKSFKLKGSLHDMFKQNVKLVRKGHRSNSVTYNKLALSQPNCSNLISKLNENIKINSSNYGKLGLKHCRY